MKLKAKVSGETKETNCRAGDIRGNALLQVQYRLVQYTLVQDERLLNLIQK